MYGATTVSQVITILEPMDHKVRAIQVNPQEFLIMHLYLGSTFQVSTQLLSQVPLILLPNIFI